LKQIQFPTKKHPILPPKEAGIIRFVEANPPVMYRLGFNGEAPDGSVVTYRDKLKYFKNEREKQKNLKD